MGPFGYAPDELDGWLEANVPGCAVPGGGGGGGGEQEVAGDGDGDRERAGVCSGCERWLATHMGGQ
jgi:hypothetical protein